MAIEKCKECGWQVSTKAEKCPNCGAKNPASSGIGCIAKLFFACVIFGLVGSILPKKPDAVKTESDKVEVQSPTTAKSNLDATIEHCFSGWDGSHRELTSLIKKEMHDPDSYSHDETRYFINGGGLIVTTTFRGKNKFGAMVKNYIKAKTDIKSCAVVEVIGQGPM